MRIGLPRALSYHEYALLWRTFFEALGAEVVASGPTTRTTLQVATTHATADLCFPAKVYVGHLLALADQVDLMRYLRRHLNRILGPEFSLQKQAYEHVLREDEEQSYDGVIGVGWYLAENPVRAGLVGSREEYPYTGCLIAGYPELDLWQEDFWERFWRIDASKR